MTNNNFSAGSPLGDENMEAHIWDYIDGASSAEEKTAIEKLIEENSVWRAKYAELLELHQMVQNSELEEPSLRFTRNVMDEIAKMHIAPAAKTYINKKVIWGLACFFFTMIFIFLVYGLAQIDWSTGSSNPYNRFDFAEIDYSKMFSNTYMNIFMMLNIVFGLMLLDKYLANKRNKAAKAP